MERQGQGKAGDHYPAAVETIPYGEYVRRKVDAKTTYIRREFSRTGKGYILEDADDHSRTITVRKGTVLFIGFTY